MQPLTPRPLKAILTDQRIRAMIEAGVKILLAGAKTEVSTLLHRLDKADTKEGIKSVEAAADLGLPYPVVLYERFLGRPFASHRDSVSELVGEVVEAAVKDVLTEGKVSFRETKRAEKITGFDQAPDFIIPDEFNPVALIEAKLTEDDGTARDKVARVQRLRTLRDQSGPYLRRDRLHRRPGVQGAPRRYAAVASGDGWQGIHTDDHASAHRSDAHPGVPVAMRK